MNPTNTSPLTDCQKQIAEVVENLHSILDNAQSPADGLSADKRASIDADICLASRSAYFDFYTWVVLNGLIDEPAERDLDKLFQRALKLMQSGEFKDSVQERYQEFKAKCNRMRNGSQGSATSTSF